MINIMYPSVKTGGANQHEEYYYEVGCNSKGNEWG